MQTLNGLAALRRAAGLLALAGCTGAWAGTATVTFVKPAEFTDVSRSPQDREEALKPVADHIIELARDQLPADCDLKLDVLDLDLAGRLEPSAHWPGHEIRIMRGGADWPRMTVRYTLTRGGKVLASGEDRMANMAYQQHATRYFADDPLRYEKTMIDDWFKQHLVKAVR